MSLIKPPLEELGVMDSDPASRPRGSDTDRAKGPTRREFITAGAGMFVGASFWPSAIDDLLSLSEPSADLVRPSVGEGLPLDLVLKPLPKEGLTSTNHGDPLFLTFDDGPLFCTGRILDLLAATGHKATFFVIGRNLLNPKLRQFAVRALQEGHDIGNHSYSHPDFSTISARRAAQEIESTFTLIQQVVTDAGCDANRQNLFFRFPYGAAGSRANYSTILKALEDLGYGTAWWDLDTNDWRMELAWFPRPSSRVIASLRRARRSDVVLLHDRDKTAQFLPEMLRTLQLRKLVSIPLSAYDFACNDASPEDDSGPDSSPAVPSEPASPDDANPALLEKLFPGKDSSTVSRNMSALNGTQIFRALW